MAKRYFDTDIWKKKWFRSLSPKYKSSWWYIISQCDHAGFFEPDIDIMSIFVGEELDETELMEIFSSRIEYLENGKWFIPKFIKFQYKVSHPDELNLGNRVHKSVYERIEKYSYLFRPIDDPSKGHPRVMLGASKKMEGAKDKDKDKDKVLKNSSKENKRKGWMIGKNKMKDWKAAVRSWEQADQNTNSTVKSTSRAYIQESDKNRDRDF